MSGSSSAELSQLAQSPEASVKKPAPKESLSKRAAEGLKKAVGTAREKLTDFVRPGLRAQRAAEEARVKMSVLTPEEESVRRTMRMEGRSEESINAHLNRFRQEEAAAQATEEESVRRTMRMEGRSEENINAHLSRMRTEGRSNAKTNRENAQKKGAETPAATPAASVESATPAAEKTTGEKAKAPEAKQGLPKTQAELDGIIAKAVAEAVTKAVAEQNTQIAQLTLENEQLKTDLAKKLTQEQVQQIVDKAVAEALAKQKQPEAPPTAANRSVVAAEVTGVSTPAERTAPLAQPETQTQPPNPEVAALQAELAKTNEALAALTKQMQEIQDAAKEAMEKKDPLLKEKEGDSKTNWLALLIATGGVLGMSASEENKKKAMTEAA